MKQFIVLMAMLPLMLGLIMQTGLAQSNFTLTVRAESIVRDCREIAAAEGGFSDALRAEMAARLAEAAGVTPGDIGISADEEPDGNGVIRYHLSVPVRRLVAAPGLFSVNTQENAGVYRIEGYVKAVVNDEPDAAATEEVLPV
jgi:hypothetical protein